MAKDPAFLFYYQDFLVGTEFMSNEEVGIYIRILCHLADKGRISKEHMLNICKSYDFTKTLQSKFQIDDEGFYFNQRLRTEMQKRKKYSESRRNNRKSITYVKHMNNISSSYDKHMENENENEDEILNDNVFKDNKEDLINSVVSSWNYLAENYNLPKVMKVTDQRKRNILNRIKEPEFNLEEILREVEKSDFLLGRNNSWRIDFDFIVSSKNNYIKILEGKYRNTNNGIYSKYLTTEKIRGIAEDIRNDPDLVR